METNLSNVGGDFNFYYAPHCCKCYGFCDHTGGPYYCTIHDPNYIAPTWTWTTPVDSDMHGKLDKIIELLEKLTK